MTNYVCGNCGAGQWSCNCWEMEAAKYKHGSAAGQDRLDQLRQEWQRERGPRGSRQ